MKKIIALLLTAALLSGLVGCGRETVYWDPTYNIPTNTQASSPTNTQPRQLHMVSISMPVVTQDYTDDDGNAIYKHTSQNISLIVPDPEVADKVILDFLNRTDMQETIDSVYASAKADCEQVNFQPYWTQITYIPARLDSGVLGLHGSYVQYSGGAHPQESVKCVNYDLVTGETLSLSDILTENADVDTICKLVLRYLTVQVDQDSLYTGYEATVTELFSKPLDEITNWCLDSGGLSFTFSPYEIGPYASGSILAVIPYGNLTSILKDKYFPVERDSAFSALNAEIFDITKQEEYTQFSEVIISQDAPAFLLSTDGMLYDIIVGIGSWNEERTDFEIENYVFRSFSLTPGDGIMVQADPDHFCIFYTTDSGGKTVYPEVNDGVITLK